MISAYHDFEDVAQLLLKSGCSIDHKDCVSLIQFGKRAKDRAKTPAMVELLTGLKKSGNNESRVSASSADLTPYVQTPGSRKIQVARNTSPSNRSITPERRQSSSSTPRRNVHPAAVHHSVNRQLYTPDQRKQYREEMDRYIKSSITTLGSALAQDCLESMQLALAEELKVAEEHLRSELESSFHQSSKDLYRRLKDFIGRLSDTVGKKSQNVGEEGEESVFKGKRRTVKYHIPESNGKVYDELIRTQPDKDLSLKLTGNKEDTKTELFAFVDRNIADLGGKLQTICRQTASKEVKAKVSKVQELLSSEVSESVEEMSRTIQRRLEAFAQIRAKEAISEMTKTDLRKPTSLRSSGSHSSLPEGRRGESMDEDEDIAREYLRIPNREASDFTSVMSPSASASSIEIPRHPPKPSPGKPRPGDRFRSVDS